MMLRGCHAIVTTLNVYFLMTPVIVVPAYHGCASLSLQAEVQICKFSHPDANYRISDAIKNNVYRLQSTTLENYPHSLLALYFIAKGNRVLARKADKVNALWQVIHDHFAHIRNTDVALHVRLGDVLDDRAWRIFPMADVLRVGSLYNPPLKWYAALARRLQHQGMQVVHIFGNAYANRYNLNDTFPMSCAYLTAVGQILMDGGLKVVYEVGHSADDDFLIMSNSKVFVPTGGGFSELIAQMVDHNGGLVLRGTEEQCQGLYGHGPYCRAVRPLTMFNKWAPAEQYPAYVTLSTPVNRSGAFAALQAIPSKAWKKISLVDLMHANLDDVSIQPLLRAAGVGLLSSLSVLDLSGNKIGDASLISLSEAIALGLLPSLSSISLVGTLISDPGMVAFSQALGKITQLSVLKLDGNRISDAGMAAFSCAMSNMSLQSLAFLSFGHNQLGDAGITAFAKALSKTTLPSLSMLSFGSNQIGDSGITALSEALSKNTLPSLAVLKLDRNKISDIGIVGLSWGTCSLSSLSWLLLDHNRLGDAGIATISQARTRAALPSLSWVSLNNNQIGDLGVELFSQSVTKEPWPSLMDLYLSDNKISDSSVTALTNVIVKNVLPSLASITLDNNQIGDAGIMALSQGLRTWGKFHNNGKWILPDIYAAGNNLSQLVARNFMVAGLVRRGRTGPALINKT